MNTDDKDGEKKKENEAIDTVNNLVYSPVKSTAIVKYSTEFSSLPMADMFPDCVGEVDVIFDAENVKKLLTLPYSRGQVSMLVHRFKATLSLNEYDIEKFLFKSTRINWHVLINFLSENVFYSVENTEMYLSSGSENKYSYIEESLILRFFYDFFEPPNVTWKIHYNIDKFNRTDMPIFGGGTHLGVSLRLREMSKQICVLTGIDCWLDNLMGYVPELAMYYHVEEIVQKYELIKIEDLPYMEDSALIQHVAKNILAFLKWKAIKAGHTYWLLKEKDTDVVKLYDLTSLFSNNMVDSSQDPFTIPVALLFYRVARNLIIYSQKTSKQSPPTNAALQSATVRMLLKNVIRLLPEDKYPQIITSAHYLFSDSLIPLNTDPTSPKLDVEDRIFTDGYKKDNMLFDVDEKKNKITRSLEKRCQVAIEHIADGLNCLKFFDDVDSGGDMKTKSPENEKLNVEHPGTPISMPYESIKKKTEGCSTVMKCESKKKKVAKNKKECEKSIGALLCQSRIETMPTWQHGTDVADFMAWKRKLKILLYEKACLVYATLAEHEFSVKKYGTALKHIRFLLESRAHVKNGTCENILMSYFLGRAGDCCIKIRENWTLSAVYEKEHCKFKNFDTKMKNVMDEDEVEKYKELNLLPSRLDINDILDDGIKCFQKAFKLENRDLERDNIQRRIAATYEYLGSISIKMVDESVIAKKNSRTETSSEEQLKKLCHETETHLKNGINAFKNIKDEAGVARLYLVTGRLMGLMATFYSEDNLSLTDVAKKFYNKALSDFQSALTALSNRRLNPQLWDTVFYERSTTTYTMATSLQENGPQTSLESKSECELELEVVQYLTTTLEFCDMETPGPNQPIYKRRAADIHHRLGILYFIISKVRDKNLSAKNENVQLCHFHYKKTVDIYLNLELPAQFLEIQLESIGMYVYISEYSSSDFDKMKSLQSALDAFLQCAPIFKIICDREDPVVSSFTVHDEKYDQYGTRSNTKEKLKLEPDDGTNCKVTSSISGNSSEEKNVSQLEKKMLERLESRLQRVLRVMLKGCTSMKSHEKFAELAHKYRNMYWELLKNAEDKPGKVRRFYEILQKYADINN